MKMMTVLFGLFLSHFVFQSDSNHPAADITPAYRVARLKHAMKVDGKWDKPEWKHVQSTKIEHFIREVPNFVPQVEVKMMYDDNNLYLIFRVQDRYVRCISKDVNGPVWKDAAVEFFFSPDSAAPRNYFNLEMNSGGTPLLGFSIRGDKKPDADDAGTIEIAHSLPQIVDPEIKDPVTWTIECRIPLQTLEKYTHVVHPKKGVAWRANFCKIAENNSNPHHMTWAVIDAPKPNFHMPQFFGLLQFQ
jgi:hypothetical protein